MDGKISQTELAFLAGIHEATVRGYKEEFERMGLAKFFKEGKVVYWVRNKEYVDVIMQLCKSWNKFTQVFGTQRFLDATPKTSSPVV